MTDDEDRHERKSCQADDTKTAAVPLADRSAPPRGNLSIAQAFWGCHPALGVRTSFHGLQKRHE